MNHQSDQQSVSVCVSRVCGIICGHNNRRPLHSRGVALPRSRRIDGAKPAKPPSSRSLSSSAFACDFKNFHATPLPDATLSSVDILLLHSRFLVTPVKEHLKRN